jgi:hypothetical protein
MPLPIPLWNPSAGSVPHSVPPAMSRSSSTTQLQIVRHPTPTPPRPTKRARLLPNTRQLTDTELGKYAARAEQELHHVGWHRFIRSRQGDRCIASTIPNLPHPATPYLARLRNSGVPVLTSGVPWTPKQRDDAVARGPHISATTVHRNFLYAEMWDMVQRRYWTVLPYRAVRNLPWVKIAPIGVVPQRDRRPRPIVDYSWNAVNQLSVPVAPTTAMQFGQTLQRIIQRIVYANPTFGPVRLMKLDLADGYYRVPLATSGAAQLGVILPYGAQDEPLIAFPLTLPMGWSHSPPYFCAFTETGADVCNRLLASPQLRWNVANTPHVLESIIDQVQLPQIPPQLETSSLARPPPCLLPSPVQHVDVYIDDFLGMAQGDHAAERVRRVLTGAEGSPNGFAGPVIGVHCGFLFWNFFIRV